MTLSFSRISCVNGTRADWKSDGVEHDSASNVIPLVRCKVTTYLNNMIQAQGHHISKKRKNQLKLGKTMRSKLLHTFVASMVVPCGTLCKMCGEKEANISCKQCGLQAYFCEQCCYLLHTNINIFHTPVVQVV